MKCVKAERNFAKEKCPHRFRDHVLTVSTFNCKGAEDWKFHESKSDTKSK